MIKKNFNIAVLASTRGTDLQAIIDEIQSGNMPGIDLKLVLSNKKCPALERAQKHGIEAIHLNPKGKSRSEFDREMLKILREKEIDLVVLVGYMRLLSPGFVEAFPQRIINVHPSLIPKYSGKDFYDANVHQAVLDNGDQETGMTIHFVDEGLDTGDIILQKTCPVLPDDTAETLKARVQELEKKWYPEVIRRFARGEL